MGPDGRSGNETPAGPSGLRSVRDRGAYGDGPLGRLEPSNRTNRGKPTGADDGNRDPDGILRAPGTGTTTRRGGKVAGELDVGTGVRPGGGGALPRAPGDAVPRGTVTPPGTPGGGGYVSPGGSPIVTTPTVSHLTFNHFSHSCHYGFNGHSHFHPFFYWSWYAWCSPYYYFDWYLYWRYPRVDYVYVTSPTTIAVYEQAEAPASVENTYTEVVENDREQTLDLSTAAERYLTLGDRAFREGRFGDAVHFYAKAVEFSPNEGALYLVLADALFATGDYHYAAFVVRKALELDPTLVDIPVDKHSFYGDPSDFDRQLMILERYVKDHPTDTDARLLLALNLLFGARPGDAADLLESPHSAFLNSDPAAALIRESAQRTR